MEVDEDASALFAAHGLTLELPPEHPFVRAERSRWQRAIELGRACVAHDQHGHAVGFAALDIVDEQPYLDQIAVRRAHMGRGVGARLLEYSEGWAQRNGEGLWLTTYAHLRFNRPYYERRGYEVVPEHHLGPQLLSHLQEQRRCLPHPEQRVAMCRRL
jgi:GNAT superfamily N-acetyltransferase